MASPRESRGSDNDRLTRRRTALFALGAAASFDASADPYASAFAMWFLAVAAGCLACVVVELYAGRGPWFARLAIGVGFALLNGFLYVFFVNMLIQWSTASGAPKSSPGGEWLFFMMLAGWIVPVARLGRLYMRKDPSKNP